MPLAFEQAPAPAHPGRLARAGEALALIATFAMLAVRYWLTVHPFVIVHLHRARSRARTISDPALRELVLASLRKRSNIEGAAAFAALAPRAGRRPAIRALVAFQSIYNYADVLTEAPTARNLADARLAHLPLVTALGAEEPIRGFYLRGPRLQDTGYLGQLVMCCRQAIAVLPSASLVLTSALASTNDIAEFQAHSRPSAAPGELERWAREHPPRAPGMSWWETAAACGSSLTVHALIAAAADPALQQRTVEQLIAAYGGPVGALHSMLDSLIDQDEDALIGQPSLVALYPTPQAAKLGMGRLAECGARAARALPDGRRHAVLVAAMASLYLSDPRARTPRTEPLAAAVRADIGPPARPALAVFALRRLAARRSGPRVRAASDGEDAPPARAEPEQPAGACAPVS